MANELAKVFVRLTPTADGFETDAKVQLKKSTKGLGVKVPIDADTKPATAKVDELQARVTKLTAFVKSIPISLDDKKAKAEALLLQANLMKLGRTIHAGVDLEGATRAEASLFGMEAALDRINGRTATAHVKVDTSMWSKLKGLFGGGGSGGGGITGLAGAAGGAGGLVSSLGGLAGAGTTLINPITIALGALAAVMAGPVIAALLPITLGFAGFAAVAVPAISKVMAARTKLTAAELKYNQATTKAQRVAALKAETAATAGLTSQQKQLMGPLGQLGTMFGKMQKAVMPTVITAFGAGLKVLKDLMPALTPLAVAAGKAVAGFLGQMDNWLKSPSGKKFLRWLEVEGPKDIKTFGAFMWTMAQVVGRVFSFLRNAGNTWWKNVSRVFGDVKTALASAVRDFNDFRHRTAVVFDGVRHDIAHIWDMIWNNTVGRLKRGIADDQALMNGLRHWIAGKFDGIRHDIASAWDTIWRNTVTRVRNGINDVVGWFKTMPGRLTGALFGLGHSLYAIGHAVLTEFWNGLKSIAGGVFGWFSGFGKTVINVVKKVLGIFSPSRVFYDIGRNLMLGLRKGVVDHAHHAINAAQAAAGKVGQFNGKFGTGVAQWRGDVLQALSMLGLPSSLAPRVLYQMQTESGGNPNAINLTDSNAAAGDPSRGLLQTIMSTFLAYAGPFRNRSIFNPLANIYAAINYARARYGPTLMSGGMGMGSGHGYALGTASAAPGLAVVGERGPELVAFRGGEQVIPNVGASGRRYATGDVPASPAGGTSDPQMDRLIRTVERLIGVASQQGESFGKVLNIGAKLAAHGAR